MEYPVESFTDEERALLAPHFTNLDRPVFALIGLPETVKGAMYARYSRYQGTLRRLFLDEFADSLGGPDGVIATYDNEEG
ncbi:MAG: thymidylate synthase, partial [Thermoleophilaceae bacterium]|nr:thymidylate synthase [Thermoleophilaceae bacterium]